MPQQTSSRSDAWKALRLNYSTPKEILRELDQGWDRRVLVIGDGSNGAYEWVIEKDGKVEKHSDCGYGDCDIALRDGLIAYFGLPPIDGYFMKQIAPNPESAVTPFAPARSFQICKDHTAADWNQPTLDDDSCILCRLFYLEAQEGLLEQAQQRAERAEDAIKDMKRPLDAQMARLNAEVTRLNGENERLRVSVSKKQPSDRRWMILSLARNTWWRAQSAGYTDDIKEAGRYTDEEALAVVERMNDGGDRPVKLVPVYLDRDYGQA